MTRRFSPAGFAFSPADFTGIPHPRFRMISSEEERSLSERIIHAITAALVIAMLFYTLGSTPMVLSRHHVITQVR